MNRKIKHIFSVLLLSTLVFTGCQGVDVGTDVEIKSNGSTESEIRISYDSSIANVMGKGILESALGDEFTVSKYNEGSKVVEQTEHTTEPLNFKTLMAIRFGSTFMKERIIENEYVNVKINRDAGFLKDKYTVTIIPRKDYYREVSDGVDEQLESMGNSSIIGLIGGNIKSAIGSIPYNIKLKVPFKIVSSNGTAGEDDHTVVWNTTLQNLNENNILQFQFEAMNMTRIAFIVVIVVIALLAYLTINKKRKSKK